jgi:hypothetical protein
MAGTISYAEFSFMLGVLNLNVRRIFIESQSGQQLDANLQYTIFDSTGQSAQNTLKPRKDPYQRQNSLYFKPPEGQAGILLNGLSTIAFNLAPRQLVSLTLCTDQADPRSAAPGTNIDNFTLHQDELGNYDRYQQFKDCL